MAAYIATLGEVVDIRTIMTFRDKAPDYEVGGNARALTIKDLVSKGGVNFSGLPRVHVPQDQLHNQLRPFDVILPGRGENYIARHYPGADLPVFPIGQINVIRVKDSNLDGNYLAWYLNQQRAQQYLRASLGGTGIKALSKTRLLAMPVLIPSLEAQRAIAELQDMQAERSKLLEELDEINFREVNAACLDLLKSESSKYGLKQ